MPYDLRALIRQAREYTAAYAAQYQLQRVEDVPVLEAILITHLAYLIRKEQEVTA